MGEQTIEMGRNKSTTDRASRGAGSAPRAVTIGMGVLSALAPSLAARWAERLFLTPPRATERPDEQAALARAEPGWLRTRKGERIATWSWGEGPTVLLAHGWGGRGAQLSAFAEPLAERGFEVVAFDAPAHGRSSGRLSSLVQLAAALAEVARSRGILAGVVAHSLGGAATALAIGNGLQVPKAVLLSPPNDLLEHSQRVARQLNLSEEVRARMQERIERTLGMPFSALRAEALALRPGSTRLLVVHDRDDREVPFREGASYAELWPGAQLLPVSGLGHRRILRDARVIERAADFIHAR